MVCVACGEEPEAMTDEPVSVSLEEVQAVLDDLDSALTQVTDAPVPSAQHGLADTLDVFVTDGAVSDYLTLVPNEPSDVVLPVGTFLVKRQYDETGAVNSHTIMVKGRDVADDVGDWQFFFAGEDGEVGPGSGGCISCHQLVPDADFVYGLVE
jgi:hypothetical protein